VQVAGGGMHIFWWRVGGHNHTTSSGHSTICLELLLLLSKTNLDLKDFIINNVCAALEIILTMSFLFRNVTRGHLDGM
jgi:hypothetical protein